MTNTRFSRSTIAARIASLRTRHRQIDEQVSTEQKRTWRDSSILKKLKRRRLYLKDEIRRYEGLLVTLSRRGLPS
ncbi:YdcH family protein [Cucumibacter marinus]|uniref:YdcH family protein n=1 Tax=Cucumibacter marinus TaxID=1121252 RepID=UPI00041C26D4|nr:YdcH family protein [Cucumibacter marinus]